MARTRPWFRKVVNHTGETRCFRPCVRRGAIERQGARWVSRSWALIRIHSDSLAGNHMNEKRVFNGRIRSTKTFLFSLSASKADEFVFYLSSLLHLFFSSLFKRKIESNSVAFSRFSRPLKRIQKTKDDRLPWSTDAAVSPSVARRCVCQIRWFP